MKAEIRQIEIPTYVLGDYEKNPVFFEKRNVQGASGNIFPMAFNNRMNVEFEPVTYQQFVLENDFIEVSMLPEIGGRIYSALDKTNNYDFVYRNNVIKPQQIALCGPWVSGGIEFNWPQHHRPTTILPVEYAVEDNEDGSTTIWMGEVEPLYRTKGMVGITVFPGKSYIQAKVRLFNRTPFPQAFMWWANLAVAVNENYRAVFPKDIHWSSDHAWVSTSPFPIIQGKAGDDGIDVQNYADLPMPGSFFTYDSKYEFLAGYDHGRDSGIVHVANRHIGTGKKIFNWGVSEFSKAWSKNLSDEDGPYVELMTGLYTRNQPDFSWIMPHECKAAEQYWYPIRGIKDIRNANLAGAVGLEFDADKVTIQLNATQRREGAGVVLRCEGEVLFEQKIVIAPDLPFEIDIAVRLQKNQQSYEVLFFDENGKKLISYRPEPIIDDPVIPAPLAPTPEAKEAETVEDIYLHALNLWQYKHPYFNAEDYLQEAIAREPEDLRCNNLLGKIWMDKGAFEKAEFHFDVAIKRSLIRNPNPYDTEPFYNMGVLQALLGNHEASYDNFYKAIWGYAWKSAGYCGLAQLDCLSLDYDQALKHIDLSLDANGTNFKAQRIKASVLRVLGRNEEALQVIQSLIDRDKLDFVAAFEHFHIQQALGKSTQAAEAHDEFIRITRKNPEYFISIAVEYAEMGAFDEAIESLTIYNSGNEIHPIVSFYLGYYLHLSGNAKEGVEQYQLASSLSTSGILHSRLETIFVLKDALTKISYDTKSPYYLGNIYYGKGMFEEGIAYFQMSADRGAEFPTTYRNLAIGYFDKKGLVEEAGELIQRAFDMNPEDERVFYELMQYQRNAAVPLPKRLTLIEAHPELHSGTDEVYLKVIATYLENQDYEKAQALLADHQFHPYEGGEGILPALHMDAYLFMGKEHLKKAAHEEAINCFEQASQIPDNYQEGAMPQLKAITDYYVGCAHEAMGDNEKARECYQSSIDANPRGSEYLYITGLCLRKLGQDAQANDKFERLISVADKRLKSNGAYTYFTRSLVITLPFEHDVKKNNDANCAYLHGLGWKGLGNLDKAKAAFNRALNLKPYMYKAAEALLD
jgi:tetratricopeptide (TPR) repeat protein